MTDFLVLPLVVPLPVLMFDYLASNRANGCAARGRECVVTTLLASIASCRGADELRAVVFEPALRLLRLRLRRIRGREVAVASAAAGDLASWGGGGVVGLDGVRIAVVAVGSAVWLDSAAGRGRAFIAVVGIAVRRA